MSILLRHRPIKEGMRHDGWRVDDRVAGASTRRGIPPTLAVAGATENGEYVPRVLRGVLVGAGAGGGSPPRIGSKSLGQRIGGYPEARQSYRSIPDRGFRFDGGEVGQ